MKVLVDEAVDRVDADPGGLPNPCPWSSTRLVSLQNRPPRNLWPEGSVSPAGLLSRCGIVGNGDEGPQSATSCARQREVEGVLILVFCAKAGVATGSSDARPTIENRMIIDRGSKSTKCRKVLTFAGALSTRVIAVLGPLPLD
jgi:hypothetical protein